jgi:uroporphyrin-III C-methyltransferase/precorrin-2 dehydrogenase/sirohydrochlorin ferrochelatase/uroporphyrin-III C-methyltransferase
MSSETLSDVVEKLTENHIHEEKLLAIIEQATTPFQDVHVSNLYDFKRQFTEPHFISPTLIIIGKVVSLHENFKWRENSNSNEHYFKPMTSQLTPINNSEKLKHVS